MAQQTKLSLKRLIALLLAVVTILTCFCSCKKEEESKEKDNSAADTYLAMAQEFLDNDDIDSALDILNKGLVATQDERISAMIAELTAQSTDIDNETVTALDDYNGTWAEESIGWVYGGLILDLAIADGTIELELSYTQGAPASRIASFTHTASTEEIKGNQLAFTFDDDGWGNLGNVVLDFSKETINCSISDVKFYGSDYSDWGFYDGKYTLYKNNNAHNAMGYTMDEYYQKFPENEPDNTPTYDISKASGILASMGITLDEFKRNCNILYLDPDDATVEAAGAAYINAHPGVDVKSLDIPKWDTGGIVDKKEYTFKKQCRDVGTMLLDYPTGQLLSKMEEYPPDYTGNAYCLFGVTIDKNMDSDGTVYYKDSCTMWYNSTKSVGFDVILIDCRDDVNYPTLFDGETVNCYAVFTGVTYDNNSEYLTFALISVEKLK